MYRLVSNALIERYLLNVKKFSVVCDNAYYSISSEIQQALSVGTCKIYNIDMDCIDDIFLSVSQERDYTILLAEPCAYVKHKIYQYLDFSHGEPVIIDIPSKVLVFPIESAARIFHGEYHIDAEIQLKLLCSMLSDTKYRITTESGTDLTFISRKWISYDFEICTAPIENSISGVIVVDGALFFKKIDDLLQFHIRDGKLVRIDTNTDSGDYILNEYIKMTRNDFENPVNKQLAEIGIGTNTGAVISDCFMEAESAFDTCHFCFGNNICYGGLNESNFHGASILIKKPTFQVV